MKKIKNISIGGIQQKIFNLVLIMILFVMAVYSVVIIYQGKQLTQLVTETNKKQRESITSITRETMNGVVSSTLSKSTQKEAEIADDMFQGVTNVVRMIADYAEKLLTDPDIYPAHDVQLPDPDGDGKISVQLLTEEGVDLDDPELREKLGLIGNISELMAALFANSEVNSCYITLPDGVMLLADDHPSTKYSDSGDLITFPMTKRDWYVGAAETGELFFTDVVSDVFTGEVGIMCAVPIYKDGELAAVAGADLFLDKMAAAVTDSNENNSFIFIVNENGHVIFSPMTEGLFRVRLSAEAEDLRESAIPELASLVKSSYDEATDIQLVNVDGINYYLTGAPIKTVGWSVFSAVNKEATDQPVLLMEQQNDAILGDAQETFRTSISNAMKTIVILLILVTIVAIVAAMTVAKRIVDPLEAITKRIGDLKGEDLQFKMQDVYRTGDEIEILAESFADLSAKTLQYVAQVKKVTAEKERIGAELNVATAIQASQLPRLFPAFPNFPEFDVFASMNPAKEVGGDFYDFFLIDNDHIGLVMADVSGKGVPAALFMMVSRVLIKSRIQNGETPGEALSHVNDQLCEGNDAQYFVTVWLGVLEISTGKGIAANAGHEHPVLRRAGGKFELMIYRHSPAVATMEGIRFREHEFELHPGDTLFVYTDGVPEATNTENELFGPDRMLEALNREPDAHPETILANVTNGINEFVAGAEQFDDITMLCLKYYGPNSEKTDKNERR